MQIFDRTVDSVIFDMDGLILDNGLLYKVAYQTAAESLGFHLSDDLYQTLLGLTHARCDEILKDRFGHGFSVTAFSQALDRQYQFALSHYGVQFRDGFVALLAYLTGQGVPIGLATSSSMAQVTQHLGATPYLERFDVVCTIDDVEHGKPHPAIYHLALQRMNAAAQCTMVLEDSNNGMRAAIAAGCLGVMVPNQAPPAPDVQEDALLIVPSLGDVLGRLQRQNTVSGVS